MRGGFPLSNYLIGTFSCATTSDVISVDRKENNGANNYVLPLLLEFEDT